MDLLIYPLVTTALYYLGGLATLTRALHTRYPDWLWNFMTCPACSGTWYGFGVGAFFAYSRHQPFLGFEPWLAVLLAGLGSMIWTPIFAALHLRAMEITGAIATGSSQTEWDKREGT